MNQNTEKQRLTSLLALKSAPQGKIDGDFKVALYAVAALYQLDFSKNSNFGLCASLLGSVGFKGDISRYKTEDYFNTLDDLVAKGSLAQICDKKVYAVPSEVKVINAKVKAVEDPL